MPRILSPPQKHNRHTFTLPDIPASKWCDYRREYEAGHSLRSIAEKYFVDPRTVRTALEHNLSSTDLGKRHAPKKLKQYEEDVCRLISVLEEEQYPITKLSRIITEQLTAQGYTGSERTVRNYLRTLTSTPIFMKKESHSHD